MCVAIYKPEGIQAPSLEILKKCWETNPDGAGFCLLTGGEKHAIEIHKGFMTWKSFVKAFKKYQLAQFEGELFIHFRITTHGGTSAGNCHPFAITNDIKLLKCAKVETNFALMHNGILPINPSNKTISDTMELCIRLSNGDFHKNIPSVFNLIEGMAGSNKIAVMTREKVHLFGEWGTNNGVYFSNMLWDWETYWNEEEHCNYIHTWNEFAQLNNGYCPYCGGEVDKDDEMFYCLKCGDIWTEQTKQIDSEGYLIP